MYNCKNYLSVVLALKRIDSDISVNKFKNKTAFKTPKQRKIEVLPCLSSPEILLWNTAQSFLDFSQKKTKSPLYFTHCESFKKKYCCFGDKAAKMTLYFCSKRFFY